MSTANFETLKGIITSRRSIYPPSFSDELIEDELIWELLEMANWAPNHRKTEPWRFHVLSGEAKTRFGHFAHRWLEENRGDTISPIKLKKTLKKALKSSHIILICMQRDAKERLPEWEEIAAVACAVQNLWLSASALGLGGYWSTPAYKDAVETVVDLQEGERCLGMFYIGKPLENLHMEGTRQAIKDKVRWYT